MASFRLIASLVIIILVHIALTRAQSISTSTPVPPLQWLNLTGLLTGPAPPPLMEASMGYDEQTRTLIIFGGESQGGFVQSSTYLLNLDTLVWSIPSPPPNLITTPSPRSAAIGGGDFAASNRHGHVIIGGKGPDGTGLSDVWEYDYNNQFWRQVVVSPGGPSPRWGASGGIDIRTAPVQDPLVPGPNNTFLLAGGQSEANLANSLSDIWQFAISGTLSSNLPDSVTGSWSHRTVDHLPSRFRQAGTVIGQQIVVAGGCSVSPTANASCAEQDAYVINPQTNSRIAPGPCPAPRTNGILTPNLNEFSSNFASQAFLLLGTFDRTLWYDDGGLLRGEVAVLDVNTGSWSRVLPSGDPGTTGRQSFPSPREGASVFSSPTGLVGLSRSGVSDAIIFGGRDASGTYLSELWVLRAYNGSVSQSNARWQGFGDGRLQTGINAKGAGVSVQFMNTCASIVASPSVPNLPTASAGRDQYSVDTSLAHKTLAPLSVALLLLATVLYRVSPATSKFKSSHRAAIPLIASAAIGFAAYAAGIAGLVSSFTSIHSTFSLSKRSNPGLNLKTTHGTAGLVLFIALYGLVPILLFTSIRKNKLRRASARSVGLPDALNLEKSRAPNGDRTSTPSVQCPTPNTSSTSPLARLHSWGQLNLWPKRQQEETMVPSDDEPPQRGFEVLNRPARTRRISGHNPTGYHPGEPSQRGRGLRNLSDVDWLERRRVLSDVDALDYAITKANKARAAAALAAADAEASSRLSNSELPGPLSLALRLAFHMLLLALCILTLEKLWSRASKASFAVFLVWILIFYASTFVLAWRGQLKDSLIAVLVHRYRTNPPASGRRPSSSADPLAAAADHVPISESRRPYVHHQPPYRVATSTGLDDASSAVRSIDTHDEDEDEDVTQQRIEDEIGRREVSIVTVPRRKLWIANPS